jgi:hypothetical protein
LFDARSDATSKKEQAAKEEKEKWEVYKRALDALFTGFSVVVGGELEEVKQPVTVGEEGQALGEPKGLSAKDVGERANRGLEKIIDGKIKRLDELVSVYKIQESTWADVVSQQLNMKLIDEYKTALGEQRTRAAEVEAQEEEMEKRLLQFGEEIDKKLQETGKEPKGSREAAEAAALLASIRSCRTQTYGALEASRSDPGGASAVYSQIKTGIAARAASQEGRRDARAQLFALEGERWAGALNAADAVAAILQARETQLVQLESAFLSTFISMGTSASGSLISSRY